VLVSDLECGWRVVAADNRLGAEGAAALGPYLGKLVQMQTLNLAGTYAKWCVVLCEHSVASYDVPLVSLRYLGTCQTATSKLRGGVSSCNQ